jgi:hypothetical protein
MVSQARCVGLTVTPRIAGNYRRVMENRLEVLESDLYYFQDRSIPETYWRQTP